MAQRGILAYGAYLPFHRLDRKSIAATLGQGGGKGTRTVASYDEDTTSLGVEAARRALRALPAGAARRARCTSPPATRPTWRRPTPPRSTPPSASTVGGGLRLRRRRCGPASVRCGRRWSGPSRRWSVLSDVRTGLPGGADEAAGGDGAVAFVTAGAGLPGGEGVSPGMIVAELVAAAGSTTELLDRWRVPGEPASRQWEERFGEAVLGRPAQAALTDALKQAGHPAGRAGGRRRVGDVARAARKVAAGPWPRPAPP